MDNREVGASTGAQNGASPGQEAITKRRKNKRRRRLTAEQRVAIWVAIIGSITTIVVAIINSPQNPPSPTLVFTPTLSQTLSIGATATSSATITAYLIDFPSFTPAATATNTPTETATIQPSPSPGPVFIVRLVSDKTTGRPPLTVKFDARDSIFHESNGLQISCRAGACFYTWKVFSRSQQIGRSENNTSGRFEYTFRERGSYTVTVSICRGQDKVDCGDSATWIEVTR